MSSEDRPESGKKEYHPFYPTHVLDETLLFYLVVTVLVVLAILKPFGLHEEADPLSTPTGIKPEWYFLSMYQLLKYVPKVVGILGMGAAGAAIVFWPFIDTFLENRFGLRRLWRPVGVAAILVVGLLGLLGHVSETTVHVLGQRYHFDLKGVPHKLGPGEQAPGGEEAH
jgi:quinol-cytochrome oxidoreductase complex cytochrome b subunit